MDDLIRQLVAANESDNRLTLKSILFAIAGACQEKKSINDSSWLLFTPEQRVAILYLWATKANELI